MKITNRYLGNQIDEALTLARDIYGEKALINVNNDGYENLILIIDEKEVMRFPRSEEIWQRSELERHILKKMTYQNIEKVPRLIKINDDPAYVIASYLRGRQLKMIEARELPDSTQRKIGRQIAEFAYQFHQLFQPSDIKPLIKYSPDGSYEDYLKRVLQDRKDPNPKIDKLAKEYYQKWLDREVVSEIVVHDDLHTGNLLFDEDYNLTGVLDFGAVCIGSPEQDLRQTFRLGQTAFTLAIETYEKLSGKRLNIETAKTWTITQELAAYCRSDSGVSHDRAKRNLEYWFPGLFDSD